MIITQHAPLGIRQEGAVVGPEIRSLWTTAKAPSAEDKRGIWVQRRKNLWRKPLNVFRQPHLHGCLGPDHKTGLLGPARELLVRFKIALYIGPVPFVSDIDTPLNRSHRKGGGCAHLSVNSLEPEMAVEEGPDQKCAQDRRIAKEGPGPSTMGEDRNVKSRVDPHQKKARAVGPHEIGRLDEREKVRLTVGQKPGKEERKPKLDGDPKKRRKKIQRPISAQADKEREDRHGKRCIGGKTQKDESTQGVGETSEDLKGIGEPIKAQKIGSPAREPAKEKGPAESSACPEEPKKGNKSNPR